MLAVAVLAAAVVAVAVSLRCFKAWMQGPRCTSSASLKGKVVVITGANTGIGKECAKDFCRRGGKVVMLCRSRERAEAAAKEVAAEGQGEVVVELVDISSLKSVRACAERLNQSLEKVDILLNNAGVCCPLARTEEGLEMIMATNHFGPFLLTNLLLPLLYKAGPGSRVVTVSSVLHSTASINWTDLGSNNPGSFSPFKVYSQSKLANLLFSSELAERERDKGVHTYALHPGVIATDIGRHASDNFGRVLGFIQDNFVMPFLKTAENGAQTSIFCCVEESIAEHTGRYYTDCREQLAAPNALKKEDAQKLWEISEQITGLK